jgi:hypothetical protein
MQFGRCSVPRYFDDALQVLLANRELFATFVEKRIKLEEAAKVGLVPILVSTNRSQALVLSLIRTEQDRQDGFRHRLMSTLTTTDYCRQSTIQYA